MLTFTHTLTYTHTHIHTLTPSQLVANAVAEELQQEQGAASIEKVVNTDDENEVRITYVDQNGWSC